MRGGEGMSLPRKGCIFSEMDKSEPQFFLRQEKPG